MQEKSSVFFRLRQAREKLGLTLDQLASQSGYAASTISSVENGHDQPSARFLAKMAELLGVRAEWLRTGRGEIAETDLTLADHRLWLPLADNYQEQLEELARMLEDFAAAMSIEAGKLKKQARDFKDVARYRQQQREDKP